MSKIRIGNFEADGSLINLPIGFIPDKFVLEERGVTNPNMYRWFRAQERVEATGAQEGNIMTGSTGVYTQSSDDQGIIAYNAKAEFPTIGEYADAGTPTARTATAAGTYVKPSVDNAQDRGSIYECVTSTGAVVTEPVYPSDDGGQVTDDGTNTWEKVNVSKKTIGYQGVVIENEIQTNGRQYYYEAVQADQDDDK